MAQQSGIDTSKDHLIRLKIIQLLKPLLRPEDLEKLLQPEPLKIFRQAFVHRYASSVNYEVYELLGDKANSFALTLWLKQTFPDEQRESSFSSIIAKFLSKENLAEYSRRWGLPNLIIKPNQKDFPVTETDKEDLFESLTGAIVINAEKYLSEGAGFLLVKELLTPIFVSEGINPANLRDYIDAVSLLKMGANVLYGPDPLYTYHQFIVLEEGKEVIFFTAEAIKVVRQGREFKKELWASLDRNNAQRSKKEAKEEVSKLALRKEGWTLDTIDEAREKKDAKAIEKYLERLNTEITSIREELSKRLRTETSERVPVYKTGTKKLIGTEEIAKERKDLDRYITEKYGIETTAMLKLPVQAKFEYDRDNKDSEDVAVLMYTPNSKGEFVERSDIRIRKTQVHQGYYKLVQTYLNNIKKVVGLNKFEVGY